MKDHYFISYSRADGAEMAFRLAADLAGTDPSVPTWIDKNAIQPGVDYDDQIVEGLRSCKGLLFLMTRDSTQRKSECKREWTRALKYKKPIIPLLVERDVEMPYRLEPREYIDFADDYQAGLDRLQKHLAWRTSPAGILHSLKDRLADAERDLLRVDADGRERVQQDIDLLSQEIAEQQAIVDDPQSARRRVAENIEHGIERERMPAAPDEPLGKRKFINAPPFAPPAWFQNRHVETRLIADFLQDDARRITTIVGRGGVGKTAMTCRLLKSLEHGQLPDDGGRFVVDGIVYLGHSGSQQVRLADLFHGLCRLLPNASAESLDNVCQNPHIDSRTKMLTLLEHFPHGCTVVLLDNFEDVVDTIDGRITDSDLSDALQAVLEAPQHAVKIAITTRVAPQSLLLLHPERQMVLELDKGLGSPYAENILRAMDSDGKLGLKYASDELLDRARERTRGYPRALEALKAILQADRSTTLEEILSDAQRMLPENVVEQLVGEAFSRLEPSMQSVMQSLAIYGRPVPPTAVDYMLQPHLTGIESATALKRLVGMQFARSEAGRYYLHPVDRSFALEQVPEGQPEAWSDEGLSPSFTRPSLFHRAAQYFRETRLDEDEWVSLENVEPLLAEFEMLLASRDFVSALEVLRTLEPHLDRWGHSRQIQLLADRLAHDAEEPVRAIASSIAAAALCELDDTPKAIDRLIGALSASHPEIDADQTLFWRLMLADAYLACESYPDAQREYENARQLADEDDLDTEFAVLQGLGDVAIANNAYDEALGHYLHALQTHMSTAMIELTEEDEAFTVKPATLTRELPAHDPTAWYPLPFELESGVVLFGVADPGQPQGTDEADSEAAPQLDGEDTDEVTLAPVLATPELGDLWTRFARLYSSTDRAPQAAACYNLAMNIFSLLELELPFASALNQLRWIASELPDTDADEILALQEESLSRARKSSNRRLEISILENLVDSYLDRNRVDDAEAACQVLYRYAEELDDAALRARSERGVAQIEWRRGETESAAARLRALLEERPKDIRFQAVTHMLLGNLEFNRPDRDAAAEHYRAAGRGFAALESLQEQIQIEEMLALVATDQRDYEQAVRRLEDILPAVRRIGIPSLIASLLCSLADAYMSSGSKDHAMAAAKEAYEIASEIELPSMSAKTLLTLGDVLSKLENFELAETVYRNARDLYGKSGDVGAEMRTLQALARLFDLSERREAEIQAAQEAWELAHRLDDKDDLRNATVVLALALSDGGRCKEAMRHMENVVAERPNDANFAGNLGWICFQCGEYDRCLVESQRALELDPAQTFVIRNMGHAYLAKGLPDEAEKQYRRAIADRKGGEDFAESIRIVKRLLADRPDVSRGEEMLRLLEAAQQKLDSSRID